MKVLITGATGLIGRHLIASLQHFSSEIELFALTRNKKKAEQRIHFPVSWLTEITAESIENCDVVINLAGEPIANKRWSKQQKIAICESRWQITKTLSEYIKKASNPPHTFISGSAIGFYGRQNTRPINESFTQYFPEFTHDICQQWESLALVASDNNTTRVVLLRTGIVLDKNEGALAKMLLPFKLGVGGKIASGEQYMSWIHIHDMVEAIMYTIHNKSLEGAINLTAPYAVSNNKFSHVLCKTISRPCLFKTPEFALRLMFGEMADLLVYGQNVYPKKLIESGFIFKYPKLTLALSNLLDD